ncbi:MAG: CapA family protein [Nocardioidaceae bacterium]|nr:CapA family protein [Nocardioidaceae bacterium]
MTAAGRRHPERRTVMLTGDLVIDRAEPGTAFDLVAGTLEQADVLFGNSEAAYTDRPTRVPGTGIRVVSDPRNVTALRPAGFDVVSCANNHMLDGGFAGLEDTLELLAAEGIATCGAGADLAAAHRPAIVDSDGVRIAFLAYTCVFPPGQQAGPDVPGLATLQTHVVFANDTEVAQSGALPDLRAIADPTALDRLAADVVRAREVADAVVVSVHGGDGSRPSVLLDYERQFAHAAIDAGALVYAGHHHHLLRGMERRGAGVIFYGLSHFVFDFPGIEEHLSAETLAMLRRRNGAYALGPREGYPLLPMHPDARMTGIALVELDGSAVTCAGLVPCVLNPAGQPVPVDPGAEEGQQVAAYLRDLHRDEGLAGELRVREATDGRPALVEVLA